MAKKPAKKPLKPAKKTITSEDIRNALKPRSRVPDLTRREEVLTLARQPIDIRLGERNSSTVTMSAPKTDQQRAIEQCGIWYNKLTKSNPKMLSTVASMIGLRRAYAVAYRELQEQIEASQATLDQQGQGEEIPAEFCDFAVQYAMWAASKPFNEHDMMSGVLETILPWLADVVDSHTVADEKAAMEERAELNERRRNTPLPIGVKHTPAQEGTSLARDRALVLIGWEPAVRWLMDEMCSNVLNTQEHDFRIVRCLTRPPNASEQHARMIRLAPSAWSGVANSDRDIDKMVFEFIEPTAGGPVDMVAIDNLSLAFTGGFVGRNPYANAGDAHRRLKKWTDKLGAGLVATVPTETYQLPDFSGNEFEQLKTFANLRPVAVTDGAGEGKDDHYKVVVGTEATVFYVPKATIDAYSTSKLILPSGVIQ
jgi:hypothetical protein